VRINQAVLAINASTRFHPARTKLTIIEQLYAPISVRPGPDTTIDASDTWENAIVPRRHAVGSWFFWAMQLLPAQRRKAMRALYAFCREVDDIADGEASRSLKQSSS